MTTLRQAAQMALDEIHLWHWTGETGSLMAAHDALCTALEQPKQEPVAWMSSDRYWMWSDYSKAMAAVANIPTLTLIPLYATPPQRPWQGMTLEERTNLENYFGQVIGAFFLAEIETTLEQRNT